MEIKYLGQSSFRMKGKNMSVVVDPFNPEMVGLSYPKVSAEIVTVSHDHADHNDISRVLAGEREPFVINRPGEYEVGGVGVIGMRTWHDGNKGEERGENIVYTFQIDGVIICHLGDLGHPLEEKQVENIGAIDVLLVPVGGEFTIGPTQAKEVIDSLSPSIVVPMHYKLPGMTSQFDKLATVEEFFEKSGLVKAREEDRLSVNKLSLPEDTEIVVLRV